MNKFKVGDKVKIVNAYNDIYRGKIATITKSNNYECYDIDLDDGINRWFDSAFELYEEQPKEYKISDLLSNFEEETEFISSNIKYKIQEGELCYYNIHKKEWATSLNCLKAILYMKFTKVEEPKLKPMTFEEAIKTGNKIKFKYSGNYNMAKGFLPFNDAIYFLTTPYFDNNVIRKLILEGTWFSEGVYE